MLFRRLENVNYFESCWNFFRPLAVKAYVRVRESSCFSALTNPKPIRLEEPCTPLASFVAAPRSRLNPLLIPVLALSCFLSISFFDLPKVRSSFTCDPLSSPLEGVRADFVRAFGAAFLAEDFFLRIFRAGFLFVALLALVVLVVFFVFVVVAMVSSFKVKVVNVV